MRESFITSKDGKFIKNGKPFRFTGANMYELCYVDSVTAEKMILDAKHSGFEAVRFWTFENIDFSAFQNILRVSKNSGINLIPVLSDMWGYSHNYKINTDWFKSGYKISYLPFIKRLTSEFKDSEKILLWELINEPSSSSFDVFYEFIKTIAAEIKAINENHLLSIGTIGGIGDKLGSQFSRFRIENFKKLYSIKEIDAVSIHDYSYDSTFSERMEILMRFKGKERQAERIFKLRSITGKFFKSEKFRLVKKIWRHYIKKNIQTARELNKPLYIGELGIKKTNDVEWQKIISYEIKKYFDLGVDGILLWSYESQGRSMDGHGYGFSRFERKT